MVDIPQEFADLLHTATLAHVATIGPKGEPQNTPVWFDWDGNHIRFSQTKACKKFRNRERDPRIALSIVDSSNPSRCLEIRGKVVRIEEDPDLHFLNAMTKKHLGQDTYLWYQPGEEHFVIVVQLEHTTRPLREPDTSPVPFCKAGEKMFSRPLFDIRRITERFLPRENDHEWYRENRVSKPRDFSSAIPRMPVLR